MKKPAEPGFFHSFLCFGGVIFIVIFGLLSLEINLHVLLIASLAWVASHTVKLGFSFVSIKTAMSAGIEKGLGAIYIFILIGVLIAALIEAGTIGSLVYYGGNLLRPSIFLPAGLLFCSLMSVATGTAWATTATIGVVLMGLGGPLGIPPPVVAGMVVSGASFGDKMSPVSDTTVLAAMSADTNIYAHIKSMLYTTVPTYIICLAIYVVLGLQYADQSLSIAQLDELQRHLANEFVISPIALLPLFVLLILSIRRFPAELSMMASVVTAIVLATTAQGSPLPEVLRSLNEGYVSNAGIESLDTLLNRGGIQSMMWTLSLALIALALGGLLHKSGFIRVLLVGILTRIKRSASLVATTIAAGVISNMSMGEAYLSIIFGGQIFRDSYKKNKLQKYMLSRCLEEGATLSTSIIPWTTSGVFMAGVLGISVLDFAPWAFFNYINPLLSIALAYLGFGIFKKEG